MPNVCDKSFCAFCARAIRARVQTVADLIQPAGDVENVDAVHDMRVASRRLRAALGLFELCLPAPAKSWRKEIRRITRALGQARDLDVQIDFLKAFQAQHAQPTYQAGLTELLEHLRRRRRSAQKDVVTVLKDFAASGTLKTIHRQLRGPVKSARPNAPLSPQAYRLAEQAVLRRLKDLERLQSSLTQPRAVAEQHQMRIAAKRLRYCLEVFASLYADKTEPALAAARQMQTLLGELHDCDVWIDYLPRFLAARRAKFARGPRRAGRLHGLSAGITALRDNRRQRRDAMYLECCRYWQEIAAKQLWWKLRDILRCWHDEAGRVSQRTKDDAPATVRSHVEALARTCGQEYPHAQHVTHLALSFFDQLAPLHRLRKRPRLLLECAGMLHDIGWLHGRAGHHKQTMRMILSHGDLGLSQDHRRIVANIARYHRRALPDMRHSEYRRLARRDRTRVLMLAGMLRLADGLDVQHRGLVRAVTCRVTDSRIAVTCHTAEPPGREKITSSLKKDLLELALNRSVKLRWVQSTRIRPG